MMKEKMKQMRLLDYAEKVDSEETHIFSRMDLMLPGEEVGAFPFRTH